MEDKVIDVLFSDTVKLSEQLKSLTLDQRKELGMYYPATLSFLREVKQFNDLIKKVKFESNERSNQ